MPVQLCKFGAERGGYGGSSVLDSVTVCSDYRQALKKLGWTSSVHFNNYIIEVDIMNNKCVECGDPFISERSSAKYCSVKCKKRAYRNRRKSNIAIYKQCEGCEVKFVVVNLNKRFCGESCRRKSRRVNKSYLRTCPTCDTEFKTPYKLKKYCKPNHLPCHKEANKLRKRTERKAKLPYESWKDISEFKKYRPEGMQLDHIIPLNHPDVCGLHNTCNFQWLSVEDNSRKSNSFDGTVENNSWEFS